MYKLLSIFILGILSLEASAAKVSAPIRVSATVLRSCNLVNTGSQIINKCNDRVGNFAINQNELTKTNYGKGKTIEVGDIEVARIDNEEYLIKVVTINY